MKAGVARAQRMAALPTANQLLDEKYGEPGTQTRETFDAKTKAWYYSEGLRNASR